MTDSLFDDIPETKSPRLLWMEKHGINVLFDRSTNRYCAISSDTMEYGQTEDEAISQLAVRLRIRLWNEEGSNE